MGQRGQAPTPIELLKARGSWRGDLNPKAPMLIGDDAKSPEWIEGEALKEWERKAKKLKEAGILKEVDDTAFGMYCQAYEFMIQKIKFLKDKGTSVPVRNSEGQIIGTKTLAEFKQYEKLTEIVSKLSQQFGMTPSARSRIQVERAEDLKKLGSEKLETREQKMKRFFAKRPV